MTYEMDIEEMEVDETDNHNLGNDRIPKTLCGLDFCFHVFNKMYIDDIIALEQCHVIPGMYWYKRHPIYKVDIIGVVVKRQENARCFIYAVDDGTGVITCCCWKSRLHEQSSEEIESTLQRCRNLPEVLRKKMSVVLMSEAKKKEGYSLGDLVHIRGKIKIFRGEREVVASYHNKLEDPNMEIVRMSELPILYRTLYDVDTLPKKVLEELTEMSGQKKGICQGKIVPELKKILVTLIEYQQPEEISVEHVSNIPEVTDLLKETKTSEERNSQIQSTLDVLEGEGRVFTKQKNQVYGVINPGCHMERLILEILKRDCVKEKFQNDGCHYLHIVDEVRKSPDYSVITNSCVLTCLNNLEYQSDVIRTSFTKYFLCSI